MTDHDLVVELDAGTVLVSITALSEDVQDDATDIAGLLTEAYGAAVTER